MPYKVNFTETGNSQKSPISVADLGLNKQTSLTFPGRNYAGYAPVIAENFLHLLENFANSSAPSNPLQGQVWYDNTNGVNQLKVYNGLNWIPSGVIVKSSTAPSIGTSAVGDIWSDTENKQIYIFSGTSWILIGPQVSGGSNTGARPEAIVDITDASHNIVSFYSDDERVAIASNTTFTPKIGLSGFSTVNKGLSLNSTTGYKFTGTSSRAESLLISGSTVNGTSFLRNDQESTTSYRLVVDSDDGIVIGASQNLTVGVTGSSSYLFQNISGNTLDIKVNNAGFTVTPISVASNGTITVAGQASSSIIVPGTTDTYDVGSTSLKFRNIYANNFIGNFTGTITGAVEEAVHATTADSATTATTATTATSATTAGTASAIANTGGWNLTPNGNTLYISFNGTNLAKLDSNGNLTVKGTVTPSGSI